MKDIEEKQVVRSVKFVNGLSIEKKLQIYDRIFHEQPNILGQALVLSKVNVPLEMIDHVLHLLLVFYHCFTDAGRIKYPTLSEDDVLLADNNTLAMLQYFDKEDPSEREKYLKMSILNYPEKNLLAYMAGYLQDNGFNDENNRFHELCIRSAKNIFDCFCKLRKDYFGKS